MKNSETTETKLGPFFVFERHVYTIAVSAALGCALLFTILPDYLFLSDFAKNMANFVLKLWPKIAEDAKIIAKANPSRAVQFIILMFICSSIGAVSLVLIVKKLFSSKLTGPFPYYVTRFNLYNFVFVVPFFWWFTYFGTSVSHFSPTVRAGRAIFYTDFGLFIFAGCAIICFISFPRMFVTYRILLFKNAKDKGVSS